MSEYIWRLTLSLEDVQDRRDGASLRRLQEALTRPSRMILRRRPANRKTTYSFGIESGGRVYYGQTVAEAADRCREALG